MRVVMLSKALVMATYRGKLAALAAYPDIELTAIVPPSWPEGGRPVEYRRAEWESGYRVVVEPVRFGGNFHLHHYPGLGARLRELRPDIVHLDEEPYNPATFLAMVAAKRAGARVLFFTWQNLFKRYPFPFGAFERFALRHTNYALAGNQEAAAILRRKGYHGPLAVIPQFGADPAVASRERGQRLLADTLRVPGQSESPGVNPRAELTKPPPGAETSDPASNIRPSLGEALSIQPGGSAPGFPHGDGSGHTPGFPHGNGSGHTPGCSQGDVRRDASPTAPVDRPFTVGMAGRLIPEKGGEVLLRACAGLEGEWRLRYLGAGPELGRLQGLAAELGVSERVRFDPPVESTEVPGWLVQVDALAVPSLTRAHWKEQFGRVIVEAMLCEVPVAGSDSGEIPNVIGGAGLTFPEGDAAALRDRLARLRADAGLRARLAAAGKARALAHYTHAGIAEATVAVYREMLARPWPDRRPRLAPWSEPGSGLAPGLAPERRREP